MPPNFFFPSDVHIGPSQGSLPLGPYRDAAASYDAAYDGPLHHAEDRAVRRWLERQPFKPGGTVLDVGCGTGYVLDLFPDAAWLSPSRYLGVDPSREMIEAARAKHSRHHFEIASAETALRATASGWTWVDTVLALFGPMNHCDEAAGWENVRRRLRPGGRLAAIVYAPLRAVVSGPIDVSGVRAYTEATLAARLAALELYEIEITGLSSRRFRNLPGWLPAPIIDGYLRREQRPDRCCYLLASATAA
jgi:SAM-dependent methyltransferase